MSRTFSYSTCPLPLNRVCAARLRDQSRSLSFLLIPTLYTSPLFSSPLTLTDSHRWNSLHFPTLYHQESLWFDKFGVHNLVWIFLQAKHVVATVRQVWRGERRKAAVPDDAGKAGDALGFHSENLFHLSSSIARHHSRRRHRRLRSSDCALLFFYKSWLSSLHRPNHHPLHRYVNRVYESLFFCFFLLFS